MNLLKTWMQWRLGIWEREESLRRYCSNYACPVIEDRQRWRVLSMVATVAAINGWCLAVWLGLEWMRTWK